MLKKLEAIPDVAIYAALTLISVLARVPFLAAYDLVHYDGTYYINVARSLLDGVPAPGPFPLGYPLLIAPLTIVMDDVRAAQIVSFLASLGTLFVLYALARRYVGKAPAILAALALAVTPVFVRHSLMTLSESSYLFWVMLSLLMYERKMFLRFGLAGGMAAITRPEGIGIFMVLLFVAFTQLKVRRGVLIALAAFAAVYSINVAVFSAWSGKLVLLQKTENIGMSATDWKLRESWLDFEGKEAIDEQMAKQGATGGIVSEYIRRLPRELLMLVQQVSAVFWFALFGIFRRRLFLLAALVPLPLFPLLTPRSDPRFVLPYIPVLILYAIIGIHAIGRPRLRTAAYVVFILAVSVGTFVNLPMLSETVSEGFASTRDAAREFQERIDRRDRIADRKPFFAFYAKGTFVKLPAAPYDDTMQYLYDKDVKILSLHMPTTRRLRPSLRPLLFNPAVIEGELRYEQVYFRTSGEVLYQRTALGDPLRLNDITPADDLLRLSPVWSPDGNWLAYREATPGGRAAIVLIAADGGNRQSVVTENYILDPICWGPTGRRIAFANRLGESKSIYIYDLEKGELERVTDDDGNDVSPSWSHDGDEIVFTSDRGGASDIYIEHLDTRELEQVTRAGGIQYPAISPDGRQIAYVRENGALMLLDRETRTHLRIAPPREAAFAPSWSPDGRFLAVAGSISGADNIYLCAADGSTGLLLTKAAVGRAMPAWSPQGNRLALISNEGDKLRVTIADGLEPYLKRLTDPPVIRTFAE